MTTNKQETYKFLGDLVVSLMGMDPLFTFSFFKHEFPISDKMLVALKRGENEYVYQYVRVGCSASGGWQRSAQRLERRDRMGRNQSVKLLKKWRAFCKILFVRGFFCYLCP